MIYFEIMEFNLLQPLDYRINLKCNFLKHCLF